MLRRSSGSAAEEEGDDSSSSIDVITEGQGFTARSRSEVSISNRDTQSFQTTSRHSTPQHTNTSHELDRRKSFDTRPSAARSRRPSNTNWKPAEPRNGHIDKARLSESAVISVASKGGIAAGKMSPSQPTARRPRLRNPWAFTPLTLVTTLIALITLGSIVHSFTTRQLDNKGCRMSYMRPSFAKLSDFDTEHTRFASKYSVYLYREGMVDEDTKVRICVEGEVQNLQFSSRSKGSPFYLYLEMLGVTNRFDQLRQRLQLTFTMYYNTILKQSVLVPGIWISLRSTSTKT
jgi:glycosylphosphatidylinositol deacylase